MELPLSTFKIQSLNWWLTRPERQLNSAISALRNHYSGEELQHRVDKLKEETRDAIASRPVTVGQLIATHPFRFNPCRYNTHPEQGVAGLGRRSINQLKSKLLSLGLTADDWPALAPHNELLIHLPKQRLLTLPVIEILPMDYRSRQQFMTFFGWGDDETSREAALKLKTVSDLIQLDPTSLSEGWGAHSTDFFRSHRCFFYSLWQKLRKKGFSSDDGKFLSWNPEHKSYAKAYTMLKRYNLTPKEIKRFASIIVAERLMI